MQEEKTRFLTLRMAEAEYQKLKEFAKKEMRTISSMARKFIVGCLNGKR